MKIISLFSGAGGLDLGFENIGFEPLIAYDSNLAAVSTYNYNRTNKVAVCEDLSTFSGEQIIKHIRSLDINEHIYGVIGGPPCQYFSNGNKSKRDPDDIRRILPIKYAEILQKLNQEFDLDFFVFENVAGLAQPNFKDDFAEILSLLSTAGFDIAFKILDAYNFGVAQHRERLIIIGWNKKKFLLSNFKFPIGSPSGLSIRDRVFGLPEPIFFDKKLRPDEIPFHPNHWTMVPRSPKFFAEQQHLEPKTSARSFRRLNWNEPSYTVAYGHNEIHIHPEGHRRLSIYEAMLLQGFPESMHGYELRGNFSQQVSLVSDAVPPPLAASLAKSVKDFILMNAKNN